jgi:hypothetical protein
MKTDGFQLYVNMMSLSVLTYICNGLNYVIGKAPYILKNLIAAITNFY